MNQFLLVFTCALIFSCNTAQTPTIVSSSNLPTSVQGDKSIASYTRKMERYDGYFTFYYDHDKGKIWLEVDKFKTEFLYVNSLPAGVGSNNIGLDRGQLGDTRVVKFTRSGPKVFLVQPNYDYRAVSDNDEERKSVEQAFAQSILWGFEIDAQTDWKVLIDLTPFLMRDAHDVARRLSQSKQGNYQLDGSRSALYLQMTKNFPENTEFESTITFKGAVDGEWIRSVVPTPEAVTVRMHHSFIQLPNSKYKLRKFDPRAGFMHISYQDYATPI